MRKWRIIIISGLAGFLAAAVFCFAALCFAIGGADNFLTFFKFGEVLKLIDENYIGDYDVGELGDAAAGAAVAAIGDRWGWYFNAEDYEAYKLLEANRYSGIGITIEKISEEAGGGTRVVAVRENTPASRGGIKPGMLLLEVGGENVRELEVADIRAIITKNSGKEFTVVLLREDGAEFEATVTSEAIFASPVEWEMLAGDIGYIDIANFESGTGSGVKKALEEFVEAGARGIVFDVRNNPGGKVSELRTCLDAILPECVIFVSVQSNGKITENTSDTESINLPMAVLVNENSYSAAEYFAAVLDEYGAAVLVGAPTTGKSRSQVTFVLSDGSALHISTGGYLTPGRVDLTEAGGLMPPLGISLSEEERSLLMSGLLAREDDPQLRAAVDEIS